MTLILAVDDEQRYQKLLKVNLEADGFEVITTGSGEEALELISNHHPDLVILDIIMPDLDGITTCERIRQFSNVPIIFLTARGEEEDRVQGLDVGADDYVVKPFYDKELTARIKVHIRIKKNQDALRQKVILDFLTNIFNKRHLFTRLKTHFNVYQRHRSPISLIFFDIDNFKRINDNHGHLTGDFVLKELCSEIKTIIRSEDELFRYGGEEFVLIVPFTSKVNTEKLAEKIRQKIQDKRFIYQEEKIKVTLSLGVASLPEDDVEGMEPLLEIADKRMIAAKKGGRNRVISDG